MIKAPESLGMEGKYLNKIKAAYEQPKPAGGKAEHPCLQVGKPSIPVCRRESRASLSAEGTVAQLIHLEDSTRSCVDLINTCSKGVEHKSNIWNTRSFLTCWEKSRVNNSDFCLVSDSRRELQCWISGFSAPHVCVAHTSPTEPFSGPVRSYSLSWGALGYFHGLH